MLDFTSKVLTVFKADTGDLKSALKDLQGEEKKLAQAQLDGARQRNEGYDAWIGKLANVNQALELGGKALSVARDSFKAYAEDLKLRSAAGTVDIEKLKAASLGLRTEHDLLTFAAKAQHGVFKVTEEQMATAQKAMVALTRAGFDQEAVTQKITDALVKGRAEGLDDFGMSVESTGSKVGDFNALMAKLAEKASGVDGGMRNAGESMQAAGVEIQESFDNIKKSIGSLVAEMAPLIVALGDAVGVLASVVGWALKLPGRVMDSITGEAYRDYKPGNNKFDDWNAQQGLTKDINAPGGWRKPNIYNPQAQLGGLASGGFYDGSFPFATQEYSWLEQGSAGPFDVGKFQGFLTGVNEKAREYDKRLKAKSGGPAKEDPEIAEAARVRAEWIVREWEEANALAMERMAQDNIDNAIGSASDRMKMLGLPSEDELSQQIAELGRHADDEIKKANEARYQKFKEAHQEVTFSLKSGVLKFGQGYKTDEQQSFLESTFGKLEDFNAYAQAFQMLTGGVTAAMDAWITGSMSAGEALQKFFADALKSLASQMAVEALKHGAYAIGSLAFGDVRGAGQHAAAAAAFGAGAAVAAAAAKASMPSTSAKAASSGAGAGASSGGGSASAGSGGGSSNQARPIQVFVGDFYNSDERRRRQLTDEAIDRALRERDN